MTLDTFLDPCLVLVYSFTRPGGDWGAKDESFSFVSHLRPHVQLLLCLSEYSAKVNGTCPPSFASVIP